jgi:tetratricopeptide (TPR) repeat protein
MSLDPYQIKSLIEAQYHYFECNQPEEAERVVGSLLEPLFSIGRFPELLDILDRAINQLGGDDSPKEFWLFHARSHAALGRYKKALAELESIELLIQDPWQKGMLLLDKGHCLRRLGYNSKAQEIIDGYREAYDIFEQLTARAPDQQTRHVAFDNQAACLFNEGTILQYFLKDYDAAMKKYGEALDIYKKVEDGEGVGNCYKQMGEIHGIKSWAKYKLSLADEYLRRALDIFQENNLPKRRLEALYELARITRDSGDLGKTHALFQEYLEIAQSLGLLREESVAKRHLAELEYLLHKKELSSGKASPSESAGIYRRSIALLEEVVVGLETLESDIWSRRVLANCHYLQGKLWLELEEQDKALESFRKSLNVSEEGALRDRPQEEERDAKRRLLATLRVIQIYLQRGDVGQAQEIASSRQKDLVRLDLGAISPERVGELIKHLEVKE